jgi:MFS family permease
MGRNDDKPAWIERLTRPGSTLGPFRFPAFRSIWVANLLSQLGAMIQSTTAAWLMTDLTRSHQMVAAVQSSTTLPILLVGVFAGAIADNLDRRKVMLMAQSIMLVASAVLSALAFMGKVTPWTLLSLTTLIGVGTAMNAPAWQASVRVQVGQTDLPQAISLNTIAFNLARSVGPAIGGLLIAATGVAAGFTVNTMSYVALIVVLLRWRPEMPARVRKPMLASIRLGLSFCASSAPVRRVLLRGVITGFGVSAFLSLLPLIIRDQLQGTELQFGFVLGAFGVGSVFGALFVAQARRRFGAGAVVNAGALIFIITLPLMSLISSVPLALPLALFSGVGWTICMTTLSVAMQVRSPEEILGRCLSIYQAATFGAMAIGSWVWGAVSDHANIQVALIGASGWLAAGVLLMRVVAPITDVRSDSR